MAESQPIKTNFTAGEISPRVFGRVDVTKYFNGAALVENFVVLPHGGLIARPGTRFVAEVKDSSAACRLIPFEFNETESYILEFGNQYIRFYSNDGAVLETAVNITGATASNPVVITAVAHGYATGEDVVIENVGGMTQINNKRFRITVITPDTFSLNGINGLTYSAYTAGGTVKRVYTLTSPYTTAQLSRIQIAQSADVAYLGHPSVRVKKLSRLGHTNWTITDVDFVNGPYLPENTTAVTMTPSAVGPGAITVTASSATFAATDVGRIIAIKHTTAYGWGRITGFTSNVLVDVTIVAALDGSGTAAAAWKLGAFSDTTGHPPALAFHEQRFWLGGPGARTQTLYGSVAGEYENMTAGTNPVDAIIYTIASDKVNPIRWLSPGKVIVIGTTGGEFIASSGDQNEAITPDNVKITRETTFGSDELAPVRIGNTVLFIQRAQRKIREFGYSFESDGYLAQDITILSEHITKSGLSDLAYQQEPNSNLWFVRADGQLVTLTYQKDQQVFGWSRSKIGGVFGAGDAVVESIGVIPDAAQDQVWIIVKRTVNAVTKRYVEYLTPFFEGDTEAEKALAVQMDSSLTYNGAPATVFSGLDHLEGQTVAILADGKVKPAQVVTGGQITLTVAASIVTMGLAYRPKVKTLTFEPGNPLGSAQAKQARINFVAMRFYQTLGGFIGHDENDTNMHELVFNTDGEVMNQSPPLLSGYVHQPFPKDYTREPKVYYEQRDPLPVTLLSVMPEYRVNP